MLTLDNALKVAGVIHALSITGGTILGARKGLFLAKQHLIDQSPGIFSRRQQIQLIAAKVFQGAAIGTLAGAIFPGYMLIFLLDDNSATTQEIERKVITISAVYQLALGILITLKVTLRSGALARLIPAVVGTLKPVNQRA